MFEISGTQKSWNGKNIKNDVCLNRISDRYKLARSEIMMHVRYLCASSIARVLSLQVLIIRNLEFLFS